MIDAMQHAWEAIAAFPHLGPVLAATWGLYVVLLGGWIVLQKREPVATISWLLGLALLPYVGFLIYHVFGPQKIRRQRLRRARAVPTRQGVSSGTTEEIAELSRMVLATTALPMTTARDVRLLVDGHAKYAALLQDIAAARRHVHLEYYIWHPDRSGQALRDALIERARAGVRVYLLLDAVGSLQARRFFAELSDAGGHVAWFHPPKFGRVWRRPWTNLRTHRKIVVIDDAIGYAGGINVSDDENDHLREDAFRDLHLRLEGNVVRGLQRLFVEDWTYATGSKELLAELDVGRMAPLPEGKVRAQVVASGPDSDWEPIHRAYVGAIHSASRRVWMATPYFVPGEAAMMALTSAALAGLDVRLMVPKQSDSRLVTLAARSYFDPLMEAGVRIHEYGPRMLHTKSLLLDDRGIADQLARLFEQDLAQAPRVRPDRARPLFTTRLPEALARLASPLL